MDSGGEALGVDSIAEMILVTISKLGRFFAG
ncbi:MAG: hypothetical protein ACI8XX_002613 [Polaribacter sp.]|jgi:hypothetical protein